ncbi:hypothetical protein [Brucella pseudintermedia]|uniref:hypothetical protein n=1 Tax=Brucella pseudintermedia TaxID=370111 RepID=UPI00320AB86F
MWADSARDRSYRKEALRICHEAIERSVELDLRTCPNVQEALGYLERNSARTGGVKRFRRALGLHDPLERAREIKLACAEIARASSISRNAD